MKLPHLLAITVIALLLGAGSALLGYASTYPEGTPRWENLMDVGGAFTVASAVVGAAWMLSQGLLRRHQRHKS
ncbi:MULTISPECIES: hypothetical protein [unclassified Curtobacterium]|uniref:hypothetical protein n=1 Tax=unclassified Curtobacterium TaxID=257496 RepID=UPI000F483B78|nr:MULTISPECIES: hypothetical protein [unclassified Curtobacterium]ROQ04749.1 hypothetical protein EDF41_3399 [Curtobacterium sp. PhB171]ROQ28301.1 hypothetical protein EDF40_1437 [Curtobacterium sp. PhB170]ROS33166.1 hypothetical protein EDF25_3223 [Curtobacterium sp. PhB131]ROS72402.1 hypothetical protein EDF30_0326 [Curtobacterium sp. PhB141]